MNASSSSPRTRSRAFAWMRRRRIRARVGRRLPASSARRGALAQNDLRGPRHSRAPPLRPRALRAPRRPMPTPPTPTPAAPSPRPPLGGAGAPNAAGAAGNPALTPGAGAGAGEAGVTADAPQREEGRRHDRPRAVRERGGISAAQPPVQGRLLARRRGPQRARSRDRAAHREAVHLRGQDLEHQGHGLLAAKGDRRRGVLCRPSSRSWRRTGSPSYRTGASSSIIDSAGAAAQDTPIFTAGQAAPSEDRYITRIHRLSHVSADGDVAGARALRRRRTATSPSSATSSSSPIPGTNIRRHDGVRRADRRRRGGRSGVKGSSRSTTRAPLTSRAGSK